MYVFKVIQERVTAKNAKAVERFERLSRLQANNQLQKAGRRSLVRLRGELLRSGVIVAVSREALREATREAYKAMPWYAKAWLHIRYRWILLKKKLNKIDPPNLGSGDR